MSSRNERTDRRASRAGVLLLTLALVSAPPRAFAQGSTSAALGVETMRGIRAGWIVGAVVGVPGFGSEPLPALTTVGVGATHLVPHRLGMDLAISTLPRGFAEGVFALYGRMGVAVPITLGRDAFLMPSGGFTAICPARASHGSVRRLNPRAAPAPPLPAHRRSSIAPRSAPA